MRIRTKALLAAVVAVLTVSAVLCAFILASLKLREADRTKAQLVDVVRGTFELNSLTDDYLRHFSDRAADQWRSRHQRLGQQIAAVEPGSDEEADLAAELQHIHDDASGLFNELSNIRTGVIRPGMRADVAEELRQRLAAQLSTKLLAKVSAATQLSDTVRQRARGTRQQLDGITLFGLLLLSAVLVGSSVLMIRTVVMPLRHFRQEVDFVGRGHLEYPVAIPGRNEIGDLARTFNTMRENLRRVTASRDELETVVQARKAAENRLKKTMDRLRASNTELEQFAYVASHDLQEPLRKISAFGDRLGSKYADRLDEKGRDYLDRMLNASHRMQNLINDLLTYSRVTTRAKPFEAVDLNTIVAGCVSDLESRIQETDGRVETAPLPTLEAEATQMRQLFQNLIGNGLKYHRDGIPPVVRIYEVTASAAGKDTCTLAVKDNGIGFEEKYKDRIFKIFQRLHGRLAYEGTGIGLAICRKIVERHGGHIDVSSQPDEGTTFTISLPRQRAATENEGEADE